MRLFVSGATGFLGGEVVRQALADPMIDQVLVIGRRSMGLTHPKLEEVLLDNFLDYSKVNLRGVDACVWCLGVTQGSVDEAKYVEITVDYPVAAAKALLAANPSARFCFVSGRSADANGKRLFARVKGRAENELSALSEKVVVFRPAYVKPTKASGPRQDLARFATPVLAVVVALIPNFSVDCDQLARCLIDVSKHGSDRRMILNADVTAWVPRSG